MKKILIVMLVLFSLLLTSCALGKASMYDECDYGYCGGLQIDVHPNNYEVLEPHIQEYVAKNSGIVVSGDDKLGMFILYFENSYNQDDLSIHKEEISKISSVKRTHFRQVLHFLDA